MGYRSDVVCLIYGERTEVNRFTDTVADKNPTYQVMKEDNFITFAGRIYFHNEMGYDVTHGDTVDLKCIILRLTHVKWYEENTQVQEWKRLMKDAADAGLAVEFYRVGEDTDDNEIKLSGSKLRYFGEIERRITTVFD